MRLRRDNGGSRSLAIYGLLLSLYPRAYLERHRAELLRNFEDLEQELPSKAALWRFIARDLAVSLGSEHTRTLWGQTAIRFAALSLMLLMVHRYPGQHEQSAWTFCLGYALGWFAGWLGRRWWTSARSRSPVFVRSFRGQAAMLVGAIVVVLAASKLFLGLEEPLVFASSYGAVIAWLAGWWANYRRTCS